MACYRDIFSSTVTDCSGENNISGAMFGIRTQGINVGRTLLKRKAFPLVGIGTREGERQKIIAECYMGPRRAGGGINWSTSPHTPAATSCLPRP